MKTHSLILIFVLFSLYATAQTNIAQETPATKQATLPNKIKVFPNPATSIVNILGLKNTPQAHIVIRKLSGTIVQEHFWAIRNKAVNIPVPKLKAGMYVVSIKSKEQKVQCKFYKK